MKLEDLGWNTRLETLFAPHKETGLVPARVAREDRGRYRVLDESGERSAEVTGRFRHDSAKRSDFPAVGDWVAVRAPDGADGETPLSIVAVLPRASLFLRKAAGEAAVEQVLASNIDTVFVVAGLDGDFNPRRLERYVTASWESGASPVVVLNKADVAVDLPARLAETYEVAPGVPVVTLSAREGQGLDALEPWLSPGATVALLGSSGAGKSTLANALLGEARQETRDVRESDSRGRHTTTHRELIPLPSGAVLIDTPGMRLLQLWTGEASLTETFPEIEALARSCRFGDCAHMTEPGCAVLAAKASGELDHKRLASWRKLQREMHHLARKQDQRLRHEELARWKAIHKSMKTHPKLRARGERW